MSGREGGERGEVRQLEMETLPPARRQFAVLVADVERLLLLLLVTPLLLLGVSPQAAASNSTT